MKDSLGRANEVLPDPIDSDGWYQTVEIGDNPYNCDRDQFEITFTWPEQSETLVLENTDVISL